MLKVGQKNTENAKSKHAETNGEPKSRVEKRSTEVNDTALEVLKKDKEALQQLNQKLIHRIEELSKQNKKNSKTLKAKELELDEQKTTIERLKNEAQSILTASVVEHSKVEGSTANDAIKIKERAAELEKKVSSVFGDVNDKILSSSDPLDSNGIAEQLSILKNDYTAHVEGGSPVKANIALKVAKRDQLFVDESEINLTELGIASKIDYLSIVTKTPEEIRQLQIALETLKEKQKQLPSTHTLKVEASELSTLKEKFSEILSSLQELKEQRKKIDSKKLFDTINPKADVAVAAPTPEQLKELHAYNTDTESKLRDGMLKLKQAEKDNYSRLRADTSKRWNAIGEELSLLEAELFISEISLNVQLLMYELQHRANILRQESFTMRDNKMPLADLEKIQASKIAEFRENVLKAAFIHEAYASYTEKLNQRIEDERNKTSLNRELEEAALNAATPKQAVRESLLKLHNSLETRYREVLTSLESSFGQFNDVMGKYGQSHGNFLAAIENGNKAKNAASWPFGLTWNKQSYEASDPIKTKLGWEEDEELRKKASLPAPEPANLQAAASLPHQPQLQQS